MVEQVEVLGEVERPKTAFVNKKYTNEERDRREEEELERLEKERKAQPEEEEQEAEPDTAEERMWKKRHGDLRRASQRKERELTERIEKLEKQLEDSTKKQVSLPKTDEEIEAWANQYPDIAQIVETIAMKKAKERAEELDTRMQQLTELQQQAQREKAEAELLKVHPDFPEIRDQDEFHDWVEAQPKWVQDALYYNDADAKSAARAIDLYKADMGITSKTKKSSGNKDAATDVNVRRNRSNPTDNGDKPTWSESQIQKMSAKEYEKNEEAIMEAIRTGTFVYDITGSAR